MDRRALNLSMAPPSPSLVHVMSAPDLPQAGAMTFLQSPPWLGSGA